MFRKWKKARAHDVCYAVNRLSLFCLFILSSGCGLMPMAQAAAPSLKALFPAGGQRGTTVEITLDGKAEKGAVWIEGSGVAFSPPDDKGKTTATIAADADLGPRLIRLVNAEGVSEPRWFAVGAVPEIIESKPNHAPDQAMALATLPVCVNGRLDKSGDSDHFAFSLKKGQSVWIQADAYALGSPVDLLLHVLTTKGVRLATASDSRNLDPQLHFTAPETGDYVVQIAGFVHPPASSIEFAGGSTSIYRLTVHSGPVTTGLFPPAVASAGKTAHTLFGISLEKAKAAWTATAPTPSLNGPIATVTPPHAVHPFQVLLSPSAPIAEVEPNDNPEQATALTLPTAAAGTIASRTDRDLFAIPVKKGQKLRTEAFSQRLGFPLDAALSVSDETGKVLASNEDQKDHGDPLLNWTAAADGTHHLTVTDQFHQGGEGKHYALHVSEVAPAYELTLAEGKPLKVVRGKKLEVKADVKLLDGWKEPLFVSLHGLPASCKTSAVAVPAKGGSVTLTIEPAADTPPSSHPFTVHATGFAEPVISQTASFDLRGDNRRGTSLSDRNQTLWLTVSEK